MVGRICACPQKLQLVIGAVQAKIRISFWPPGTHSDSGELMPLTALDPCDTPPVTAGTTGVPVAVCVTEPVGVAVPVAVGVEVIVAVAVGVTVGVAVAVGVAVDVAVGVVVGVAVDVSVGVAVDVSVGVAVGVSVRVVVTVGVSVDVPVGVADGFTKTIALADALTLVIVGAPVEHPIAPTPQAARVPFDAVHVAVFSTTFGAVLTRPAVMTCDCCTYKQCEDAEPGVGAVCGAVQGTVPLKSLPQCADPEHPVGPSRENEPLFGRVIETTESTSVCVV